MRTARLLTGEVVLFGEEGGIVQGVVLPGGGAVWGGGVVLSRWVVVVLSGEGSTVEVWCCSGGGAVQREGCCIGGGAVRGWGVLPRGGGAVWDGAV